MRRLRIGYACALSAGVAGPMALVACGADNSAGPVSTPAITTSAPASPVTSSSSTPSAARPTTPKPLPETGPEPGYDRMSFGQSAVIDNKWFPLRPGTRLNYRGQTIEDGDRVPHSVTFIVTDLTKVIDGVRTVVIWERDYKAGELEEAELAFFAQADDGKIWHFGQYPEVFEEGKLVETPVWIHGFKGARAGITIKALPEVGGRSYSQGWGPEVGWSDRAKVHQVGQRTCVAAGCFPGVLVTDEFSLDEPGAHQLKYYAPGVGTVRVGYYGNDPTKETLELVSSVRMSPAALAEARTEVLAMEKRAYQRSKDVYGRTARAG